MENNSPRPNLENLKNGVNKVIQFLKGINLDEIDRDLLGFISASVLGVGLLTTISGACLMTDPESRVTGIGTLVLGLTIMSQGARGIRHLNELDGGQNDPEDKI